MIPIGDDDSGRTIKPLVNYLFLFLNIFVFFYYQHGGANQQFVLSYSTVPAEIITGRDISSYGLGITPVPVYLTLIFSMFMHGNLTHLAGNMIYLWVFGDNLENKMGHTRYFIFYLLCGVIAALSQVALANYTGKNLFIPSLGASGAISGVLGGYILLFPRNTVRILVFIMVIRIPAFITLGLWIVLQLFSGYGSLNASEGGGVAYAAHIGGFFAGLVLVNFFARRKEALP